MGFLFDPGWFTIDIDGLLRADWLTIALLYCVVSWGNINVGTSWVPLGAIFIFSELRMEPFPVVVWVVETTILLVILDIISLFSCSENKTGRSTVLKPLGLIFGILMISSLDSWDWPVRNLLSCFFGWKDVSLLYYECFLHSSVSSSYRFSVAFDLSLLWPPIFNDGYYSNDVKRFLCINWSWSSEVVGESITAMISSALCLLLVMTPK